ncbi:MAG: helix-turn-helix protein [Rhizobium sp.]|nr:helix-turn-helix protein [Rhizobium sp.]
MQIMPLDILIAHKAINLSTALSNSDKRVAGVLLDHFNRKTGQCDPGQNAIADLIGMSRRTVIRSVDRLVRLDLFRKVRHGGKYHRNRYEPVWPSFREVDAAWCLRRKNRKQGHLVPNMSPSERQPSHVDGDSDVNQTYLSNQIYRTSARVDVSFTAPPADPKLKGSPRNAKHPNPVYAQSPLRALAPRSAVAARDSAERRWNVDLLDRWRDEPMMYGSIVEAIDNTLISTTTDIELQRPGSGLAFLMAELAAREHGFRASNAGQAQESSDV